MCGLVSVGSPKKCLEKSTTATTPVFPSRLSPRVMTFSRYMQSLDGFVLLLLTFDAQANIL